MEPVTIATLVIGGLSWTGSAALGSAIGNPTDRMVCNALRHFTDRVAGLRGLPQNHDVARAVRLAQLQALERLILDYRKIGRPEWSSEPHTRPDLFFERSLDFCARTIGRCRDPKVKLNLDVTEPLEAAIVGILAEPAGDRPAAGRTRQIAALAEGAVLDELRTALDGVGLPEGFETHFHDGVPNGVRFLDLFGAYIHEQIKTNPRFETILTTGQLSRIEGLTFDIADLTRRFGETLGRIAEDTAATRADVAAIAERQDSMAGDLAELLAIARAGGIYQRAAEQGIPEPAVRAIVERLGGEGIGRDDLIPWLENWIEAVQRELGRRSNEGEAFEAARQEADRRFRQGRFADIPAVFMEELEREEREERERQVERKRSRLRLLEEAIHYAELTVDGPAAVAALRRMAAIEGISGPDALGVWLFDRAREFYERGDHRGDNPSLVIAVAAYRAALEEFTRERMPLDWAMTQNNLGNALGRGCPGRC